MKDRHTDAITLFQLTQSPDFPRTADQRVYHLGLRAGEVANRIVTVGSPSRADTIASFLDANPQPFVLPSERGFLTITGRYEGTPVSIISIGMGAPNMDFFVREVRECVSGDMYVVRLGSCGGLADIPVGSIVVPKASVSVNRNPDFDFCSPDECTETSYRISKEVRADPMLHLAVCNALDATRSIGTSAKVFTDTVNASADSFYSSQGRQTSFQDQNADLIERLHAEVPDLATLEMETFHLFHLGACWGNGSHVRRAKPSDPLPTNPVESKLSGSSLSAPSERFPSLDGTKIATAAAQLVFASRTSQKFISPGGVADLERWAGRAMLKALTGVEIPVDRLHPEQASVWMIHEKDQS